MESNWRWNVAKYGLSFVGTRLLARKLSDMRFAISDWPGTPLYITWVLSSLVDQPDAVPVGVHAIPEAHPRFPYGEGVEPD